MNEKIIELASKPVESLSDDERQLIVSRIEGTCEIVVTPPADEKVVGFVKGYWEGDAKTVKEIVNWSSTIIPERVDNRDIGLIETHKNAIRSILFHTRFRGPLKVLVLQHLGVILRNAVLFNKGQDGDEFFYNLAHRLRFEPGDGKPDKEFIVRLIVKETADGNRTWTVEFSNKKELTGMPTTGEAATVMVTHLKSPSTHNILKKIYAVNGADIAVIILIGQEKIHLRRCIEKLAPLNPRQIFLVESQPDDGGVAIAKETAAKLGLRLESVYHKWPGTQAVQFNWALDQLEGKSKSEKVKSAVEQPASWILRLDADEYLLPELIEEIKNKLPRLDEKVAGVVLKRRHVVGWLGDKWVKHGMYPTRILRLFRRGCGKSDGKLMDEHIVVNGEIVEFENDFVDHSLISFADWKAKHRNYAKREAQSYLSGEKSAGAKAAQKAAYYKLPRYVRAVMYFCIRYFLKGGFLDGVAGWRWNFWQGLWYRWIVDVEIGRLRSRSEV